MTTNHKTDGIYLPADDRRDYVAWSEANESDFVSGYWNKLWRWYEAEGFGHVAAYLRTLDVSDFDPKAPPLKTPAFWAIVSANHPAENAELADLLDKLEQPDAVTLDDLVAAAAKAEMYDTQEWLKDRKNRRSIPHRLEQCGYVPVRNSDAPSDGLFKVGSRRKAIYARSDLTATARLTAAHAIVDGRVSPKSGR